MRHAFSHLFRLSVTVCISAACGGAAEPADSGADASADVSIDVSADGDVDDVGAADTADVGADTGTDALDATDAGMDGAMDAGASLAMFEGCFEVSAPGDTMRLPFGELGTEYPLLVVELEARHGGWREDVFDRDILNHNLFGLFRNGTRNFERYISGLGAQIRTSVPGLRPRAIFYGRVDLEERPMGEGFMSYTSFRDDSAPWTVDATYQIRVEMDAAAREQRIEILEEGTPFSTITGAIPYYGPELTSDGWYLELGSDESAFRDVSPVGWQLCDVRIHEGADG